MNCGQENKDTAKACKKCGRDLSVPPAWFPDARWHLRTLGIIYACLLVFYFSVSFLLRRLPKPYNIRKIPMEMTPWLRHGNKFVPDDDLQPPQTTPQVEAEATAAKK
jgi:hypothetical protein